jgi:hypothetical protein
MTRLRLRAILLSVTGGGTMKFSVAALVAVVFVVFPLSGRDAFAGEKIERSCGPNGVLVGGFYCEIKFSGEITRGDAGRLEQAISTSPHDVPIAKFDSPGGDPFEALKIADVLNKYFVSFATGRCNSDAECATPQDNVAVCASACALIYLAANERFGNEVFLHRPSFPASFFAALSAAEAKRAYNTAWLRLRDEMAKRAIPQDDIELIMSIPSASIERIRTGYPAESPWMAEWLAAKCGVIQRPNIDPKILICESDATATEQHRIQGHN